MFTKLTGLVDVVGVVNVPSFELDLHLVEPPLYLVTEIKPNSFILSPRLEPGIQQEVILPSCALEIVMGAGVEVDISSRLVFGIDLLPALCVTEDEVKVSKEVASVKTEVAVQYKVNIDNIISLGRG